MRVVLHIGLHKTGTTYFQNLAYKNHDELLKKGIYYDNKQRYAGHHEAIWQFLRGDFDGFKKIILNAKSKEVSTLLISSEDMESLIFRPNVTQKLIYHFKNEGVQEVVFFVYIRRQDNLFWSLYSELSKHIYVDSIQMLSDILRLGYLFVDNGQHVQRNNVPYWYFCFDHQKYITFFENFLSKQQYLPVKLMVFKFENCVKYLGEEIFAFLQCQESLLNIPDSNKRNASIPLIHANKQYQMLFERILYPSKLTHSLKEFVAQRTNNDIVLKEAISLEIMKRFQGDTKFSYQIN